MNDARGDAAGLGLAVSLRKLAATLVELAQVRLELLGTELEQQKLRIIDALASLLIGVVLLAIGLLLAAGLLVLVVEPAYRLPVLALLALAFIGGGALALRRAGARLQTPPGAFAASVGELAADRAKLTPPPPPGGP